MSERVGRVIHFGVGVFVLTGASAIFHQAGWYLTNWLIRAGWLSPNDVRMPGEQSLQWIIIGVLLLMLVAIITAGVIVGILVAIAIAEIVGEVVVERITARFAEGDVGRSGGGDA